MMLCILIFLLVVSLLLYDRLAKPKHYPPGPFWWPFLGNLPQIGWKLKKLHFHQLLENLTKQHGPILGLRLANQNLVVISGARNVKKLLTSSAFDARPDGFFYRLRTFGKRLGVVFVEGHSWREMRRFVAGHLLRDDNLSHCCELEVQALVHNMMMEKGEDRDIEVAAVQHLFNLSVLNTLWALMVGERLSEEDSRLQRLFDLLNDCFRLVDIGGGVINYLPFLRHIIPEKSGYLLIKRSVYFISKFLQEAVDQCRTKIKNGEEFTENLICDFIRKQKEGKEDYTDEQLISVCLDLFMAGSETTSITISQTILYLIKYPEYQKRIHSELHEICPRPEDWPTWKSRLKMPFTEAFLNEVHRHQSLAPLAIPHRTVKDTQFGNFIIPKDTNVAVSLWSVHRDPEFWKDPNIFNPYRFLDANENLIRSSENLMPFGSGKRRCLGESLARVNVFVILTSMLHAFDIKPISDAAPLPPSLGLDGITLGVHPFSARFIPRPPAYMHITK